MASPPCEDCGHRHDGTRPCADHWITDDCPREGVNCPRAVRKREARRHAAEQKALYGDNPDLDDLIPPPED